MFLVVLSLVIPCGPPAAVVGVAGAVAAHAAGVVPPFDGQFFDPTPPAGWPGSFLDRGHHVP